MTGSRFQAIKSGRAHTLAPRDHQFSRDALSEGFARYLAVPIADQQQVIANLAQPDLSLMCFFGAELTQVYVIRYGSKAVSSKDASTHRLAIELPGSLQHHDYHS